MGVTMLLEIGEWCITKDTKIDSVYADHLGCSAEDEAPIVIGDLCWAHNDTDAECFYCREPVPAEIQALVLLQMKC